MSRRERVLTEAISLALDEPFYGIPMTYLKGMNLREVLSEKMRAVMVRGSARDLYDMWSLIGKKMVEPDKGLMDKKLAFYGRSFDELHFLARVEGIGEYWHQELKPIIIGTLHSNTGFEGQGPAHRLRGQVGPFRWRRGEKRGREDPLLWDTPRRPHQRKREAKKGFRVL